MKTQMKKMARTEVKKHEDKMHKGKKYAVGGKVRGCGMAKKGTSKTKMY